MPGGEWHNAWVQHYQVISTASIDDLWNMVANLSVASSWHPFIGQTNLPYGLTAKPGLIYRAVTRVFPLPIQIFVERVRPQELLSVRVCPVFGCEERVTYRLESTLCGTQVSYSIAIRGWLSPILGSLLRPHIAQVAACWVQAAEQLPSSLRPSSL